MHATKPSTSATISGRFSLQDHRGNAVTQDSYAGYYRLVFFGFTNCPDICPTTLHNIAQLMRKLGDDSNKIVPLFISVDHENDSVDLLANYVAAFHPSVVGLTGSAEQIRLAADGYNTTYGKNPDNSDQFSSWYHSSYLYLMDKDGKLLDLFSFSTSSDVLLEELARLP